MKIRDGEEMTLKQRLYMTPLDKFRIFGKFPWPLTISIMLVVLTSLQVLLVVASSTNYSYNQTVMWNNVFLNKDVQGSDTSLTNSYNIFSLTSLHNYIKDAVGVIFI